MMRMLSRSLTSLKPRRIVHLEEEEYNDQHHEALTTHTLISKFCPECCWTSLIAIKRAMPRSLYTPVIFVLSCALLSLMVVPVTW